MPDNLRSAAELTLHEEVEVGSSELLMDGLQQDVLLLARLHPSFSLPPSCCRSSDGRWLELGGVGEAEGRAVDQAVQSDERQGDGDDASQTAPAVAEHGDVRDDAEQRFGRPEEKEGEDSDKMRFWLF